MSWMKHRAVPGSGGSGRPPPTSATPPMPPVQMYNPNQHSTQQINSQWQQVDLSAPSTNNSWYDNQLPVQQQQNNWYQPQQPTYATPMQQQHYSNQQSTPYYPPQQQMHYQQQTYQQPAVPQPQPMQPYMNSSSVAPHNAVDNNSDAWNDWNTWGDEDNSNSMQNAPEESPNANLKQEVVEDSFANNQTWNWSADGQKMEKTLAENDQYGNDSFPTVNRKTEPQNDDRFVKPAKSETVTPQWSIESQPSQDSSADDVVLLQSDTEQKHIANVTATNSTSTNTSNPPSSGDLTSHSQTSTATNVTSSSTENKEVLQDNFSPNKNSSGYLQSGTSQQSLPRPPSMGFRNNTPGNSDEVPSSTLLQSERNQYLETGQLLDDNADSVQVPPPGFSRVVVGQRESNDDVRFGPSERTLPAGSDVGAKTSTYRPRGDTSDDDDEDSAFDDNEPLAPTFPTQPILPRSATIGAETTRAEQRDTHMDGANTLDDQALTAAVNVGEGAAVGGGSSVGEGGSGPEGQEENSLALVTARIRQLAVSGGESDNNPTVSDAVTLPRRSSKQLHTNELSEELPTQSEDAPPNLLAVNASSSQSKQRTSNQRSNRGRYTPTNDDDRHHPDRSDRRGTGTGRSGDYRRRVRNDDSDYDRDGGAVSGDEDPARRDGEGQPRRRRGGEDEGYAGQPGRRKGGDDRDRYHYRDDHRSSYYRSSNKRRDDYDDYDDDLNASRASSRSESLQEVYRGDRRGDRDRDGRRHRGDRERDRDGREKQGRGYGPRRADPYGGAGGYNMQGYYDPYGQSSAAHAHPYYYRQYQYYENLRVTNPQAYADWYRKFYQGQQGVNVAQQQQQQPGGQRGAVATTAAEDRASLHSGRSSANDDLAKERQDYTDSTAPNTSSTFQPIDTSSTTQSQYGHQQARLTPAKFSTAHAIANLASSVTGHLVHVPVQYPQDGDGAVVHLVSLGEVFGEDGEYGEMVRFPGPLVRGVTHKKTVIEYCEGKIRTARGDISVDCDSYILLWELLILLLSHNGVVVGADISDLLMGHNRQQQLDQNIRPSSVNSNASSNACIDQNSNSEASNLIVTGDNSKIIGNGVGGLKEDAITNKFRQYLIYGSVKEALEWAMKNGLWGHALFLASKLDKRTYANVMKRFANGLPINDPLQTLYQLLSGSIPAAVTCVAEERWGDWRPHLAMILANATASPDLDRRSILALGDTLDGRGSIYAAQFCYLMAQVEFSGGKLAAHDPNSTATNDRLVLLGADRRHAGSNVRLYARTEAIHMTEVYEYACGLNGDGFFIPAFQTYKYMLATRLCDYGLVERSLSYLERIATILIANSSTVNASTYSSSQNTSSLAGTASSGTTNMFHPVLVSKVCELADRLRYCDPTDELQRHGDEQEEEDGGGWLERLLKLDRDYKMGLISHSATQNHEVSDNSQQQFVGNAEEMTVWQQPQQQQQQWQPDPSQQQFDFQQQQQQQQLGLDQTLTEGQGDYSQQQTFWTNPSQQLSSYNSPVSSDLQEHLQSPDSLLWNHTQTEDVPQQRPQISMPNQSSRKAYDEMEEETSGPKSLQPPSTKGKNPAKSAAKSENKGWLDGIFGRFSMRPKNQMKLPDDKNPTIVWDPAKKRWINTEEDGGDGAAEVTRPPPKMADLTPQQTVQPMSLPVMSMPSLAQPLTVAHAPMVDAVGAVTGKPPMQGGNMFKMQRGRNLKKSYVDVFNPGGSAPALLDGNVGSAPVPASGVVPNFFIPQQLTDPNAPMDFLTPTTGMPSIDHPQQPRSRSRCSSPASSLSREVTHYMSTAHRLTPTPRPPVTHHARR